MTIIEAISYSKLQINTTEYILSKLLKKDRIFLHLNRNFEFDETEFLEIINKINSGYPIEYIFQEVEFFGDKFFIKEGVLIPRDDTESLIEESIKELKNLEIKNIAEIGVGSGVISITLAKEFPNLEFIATDINLKALELTKENIKKHDIKNIKLFNTSLLDNIDEKIDVIISNPPYVEESHKKPNQFEPDSAFFAKDEGTYLLKEIVKEGIKRKVKLILCEMGYQQKESMEKFFKSENLQNYRFYKDLSDNYRGFVISL